MTAVMGYNNKVVEEGLMKSSLSETGTVSTYRTKSLPDRQLLIRTISPMFCVCVCVFLLLEQWVSGRMPLLRKGKCSQPAQF